VNDNAGEYRDRSMLYGTSFGGDLGELIVLVRGLGQLGEQLVDLGLPVPAVTAGCANRPDPAGYGPSRDGFGVHPEQFSDFGWRQQSILVFAAGSLHALDHRQVPFRESILVVRFC
jgi:hypothetical protein